MLSQLDNENHAKTEIEILNNWCKHHKFCVIISAFGKLATRHRYF